MENREIKNSYQFLFNSIRTILNDIDPEFLSPGQRNGAPNDEYDLETSQITNYLIKNKEIGIEDILNEINRIWIESFGKSCDKSKELSAKVLDLKKQQQL